MVLFASFFIYNAEIPENYQVKQLFWIISHLTLFSKIFSYGKNITKTNVSKFIAYFKI